MKKALGDEAVLKELGVDAGRTDTLRAIAVGTMAVGTGLIGGGAAVIGLSGAHRSTKGAHAQRTEKMIAR